MAWTQRYVRADAAGGGDGTTNTNSGGTGAWSLTEGIANEAAGMCINLKAGTYARTTNAVTLAADGTEVDPIWWRGFKTSPGDQDSNRAAVAGTDIPLLTFTSAQVSIPGAFHILSDCAVTSTNTTDSTIYINGQAGSLYGVRAENTGTDKGALRLNSPTAGFYVGCWFKATATGYNCVSNSNASSILIHGCSIIGGVTGLGTDTGGLVSHTIFSGQAGDACYASTSGVNFVNCSFYGPLSSGIRMDLSYVAGGHHIINCHFENVAGAAAINNTSGDDKAVIHVINCSYYNCTANTLGITNSFAVFDKGTLAGSGFANAAGGDFTASALTKAIGYPGVFENIALTGYLDNGAVQRQESSSGGGTAVISPFTGTNTLLTM